MSVFSKPLKSQPFDWQGEKLAVVSLGCGNLSGLSKAAMNAISEAELILGAPHHFYEIELVKTNAQKIEFPSPFSQLAGILKENQTKKTVVLASGDALFYGVGSWLNKLIGSHNIKFFPNISSVQTCFHAIGL